MNYKFFIIKKPRVFFDIERCLKPEENPDMDEHQKNLKDFEDSNKNGEALNAFGKMLGNFIDGKSKENPQLQNNNKAEDAKKGAIIAASNILNNPDPKVTTEEKIQALKEFFKSFQEDKDAFPQAQDTNTQGQNPGKDKSEKFLGDLMKTIGENRVASQETNANFKNRLPDRGEPPYKNPKEANAAVGSLEKLNGCM